MALSVDDDVLLRGPADRRPAALSSVSGVDRVAVQTTQIAPTILALLGLSPKALQGVRRDHTRVLPLR